MEKTAQEIAALKFIKNGKRGQIDENELALSCDKLIQQVSHNSLEKALGLACKLINHAEKSGGQIELTAQRAWARVNHQCGNHSEALKAYLKARRLTQRNPILRARIDRALIDVYMYLGDFKSSHKYAKLSIETFKSLQAESDLAQSEVNFANLLHRQDRHRDAERLYRKAGELFEKVDNKLAMARCYYNRANTLVQLFEINEADSLYNRAKVIYDEAGFMLEATDTRYGLAWLWMLTGKFHHALLELSACEKAYNTGGDPRGEALCVLDRAEIYLALGLYDDAYQMACKSEKLFIKLKLQYELAKAFLFKGQAALALGNNDIATKAKMKAESAFKNENNLGFLGAVHLLAADLSSEKKTREYSIKSARGLFSRSQLPLWEAICDLRLAAETKNPIASLKRLSVNAAVQHVPFIYTAWQTTLGDYKYKCGQRSSAIKYWKSAANRLDLVRSQLPPVELRSAYALKPSSPHRRLIAAEIDNNPIMAAVWSERYKTAGIWAPISPGKFNNPARQEIENALAGLAHQVAHLSRQLAGGNGERGIPTAARSCALSKLQKELREKLFTLEKNISSGFDNELELAQEITAKSREITIIQFHLHGDEIIAFVHSNGRTNVKRFPDGRQRLSYLLQKWHFVLESEILSGYLTGMPQHDAEIEIWKELGEWLWKPLEVDGIKENILIIPEGELANLPFQALIIDEFPLVEKYSFIYSPSFRHYISASRIRVISNDMLIFGGKADDIPDVYNEMQGIVDGARENIRVFDRSRRQNWPSQGEYKLWHYSGHAMLKADNPFYSYLSLEDGPLFAVDFRLKRCLVELVTLAACRSGEQVAMPGEESTGLVRSLLEMGAKNIIASHWPVSDKSTAFWMKSFYDMYLNGDNIFKATRQASLMVRERYPSAYHWAAFSISGAGI